MNKIIVGLLLAFSGVAVAGDKPDAQIKATGTGNGY
jgi:hypothetical protein